MSHSHPTIPSPKEALRLLADHPRTWLVPALAVALLAAAYAAVRPDAWRASQALIVRNEAAGSETAPGKFRQIEDMKTVQETILELVRGRGVLRAALVQVGPPAKHRNPAAWPTEEDVAGLRESVKLVPPKGAEFGRTEVFYLEVRDGDRARSLALCEAICENLEARFQAVRDARAKSMIGELVNTVDLARSDLDDATARLTAIEKETGADLSELRALQDPSSGDSAMQRTGTEIRAELRLVRTALEANRELLALLRHSQGDPGRLLAAPNQLLESQPALRRLKEGLVDAQLRTASLRGTMSDDHPRVKAALEAEEEVGRHLHAELAIALRGVEAEMNVLRQRESLLDEHLAESNGRLARLAGLRANYANLLAENAARTNLVERAERELADARAVLAGANAASLIDRVDAPDAGTRPIGPSRALIVLLGLLGGAATGVGLLVLNYPAPRAEAGSNGEPVPHAAAGLSSSVPATSNGHRPGRPGRASLGSALERIAAARR